jgi:hypothetical protein
VLGEHGGNVGHEIGDNLLKLVGDSHLEGRCVYINLNTFV